MANIYILQEDGMEMQPVVGVYLDKQRAIKAAKSLAAEQRCNHNIVVLECEDGDLSSEHSGHVYYEIGVEVFRD